MTTKPLSLGDYFWHILELLQEEQHNAGVGDPKTGFSQRLKARVGGLSKQDLDKLDNIASIADNLPDATREDAIDELVERIEMFNPDLARRVDYELGDLGDEIDKIEDAEAKE